jgi:hypothetical protein
MPIGSRVSWENEKFSMGRQFENAARSNHYQSLARLAERGGLVWREAAAIVAGVKFERITKDSAVAEQYVRAHLATPSSGRPANA